MRFSLTILFVLLFQDPGTEVPRLLERLKSDQIQERDEASRRLVALGAAARIGLEGATRSSEAEYAARAREILAAIETGERLAPLFKIMPAAEERLKKGDDRAWTELLLEVSDRRHHDLRARNLEPLCAGALRGMVGKLEIEKVCNVLKARRLKSSRLQLFDLARAADDDLSTLTAIAACHLAGRGDVPDLIRLLQDRPDHHQFIFDAFNRLSAVEAAPAIRPLLRNPNYNIRREAVMFLSRQHIPGAADDLLPLLEDAHWNVRYWALQELADLGERRAIPAIVKELESEDRPIRRESATALAKLGARDALPKLRRLLDDPSSEVWGSAARALARLNDRESVRLLIHRLEQPGQWNNADVLNALGELRATDAVPIARKCLTDPVPVVRAAAALCLADLNAVETFRDIERLLKDDSSDAPPAAAAALARLDRSESSKAFLRLSEEPDHRGLAFYFLANSGDRGAVDRIDPFPRELYENVLRYAGDTIRILDLRTVLPWLRETAEGGSDDALTAAELLAAFRDRESIPILRTLLKIDGPGMQARLGIALAKLGARETAPDLLPLLVKDHDVRHPAARALALMGRRDGVPILLEGANVLPLSCLNALRSPEAWTRLEQATLAKDVRSTRRGAFEEVARVLGLRLELPEHWEAYLRGQPDHFGFMPAGLPVLEWVERAVGPYVDFIIESDRLRIVTAGEALEFWEAWWQKEEPR